MSKKHLSRTRQKIKAVMHEFKGGTLRSGRNGPRVKTRRQAVAIGMSEAGKSRARFSFFEPNQEQLLDAELFFQQLVL